MNIFKTSIDKSKYILAKYKISTTRNLSWAAFQLAVGQSVGNPNVRNSWETDELFENHSCIIVGDSNELASSQSGEVLIGFPIVNIDIRSDGISHLLCMLMGGQLDIEGITGCRLIDIEFPDGIKEKLKGPRFGLSGMREYTKVYDKPLLGGIIKPKTGVSPQVLSEMVRELVDGGVNFIKEDEIMSDPRCCPLEERLKHIVPIIEKTKVVYCYTVNADAPYLLDRIKMIADRGGNGVHVNFWSGLGSYRSIRDLGLNLFLHFQTSGMKILSDKNHRFGIDWKVLCKITSMIGIDTSHVGMIGGYGNYDTQETIESINVLRSNNVVPALSCGMHPGLVNWISKELGHNDWMANVGGAIHGHPMGTIAGAKAMRQSIDRSYGAEYQKAIDVWGTK